MGPLHFAFTAEDVAESANDRTLLEVETQIVGIEHARLSGIPKEDHPPRSDLHEISPRDLTRGLYHFGHRPIDLYRRIFAGINGTPMPSHAAMKDPKDASRRLMSDEDLWSLVHYAQSLTLPQTVASQPNAAASTGSDEGTH